MCDHSSVPSLKVETQLPLQYQGTSDILVLRRTALDYDPVHYRARKLLGSARYALGDLPAARDALQFALTQCPEYADAQCDLGEDVCPHHLGQPCSRVPFFSLQEHEFTS